MGLMAARPFLKLGEEERVRGGGGDGGGFSHRPPAPRDQPGSLPSLVSQLGRDGVLHLGRG